jgi:hypothetical protein
MPNNAIAELPAKQRVFARLPSLAPNCTSPASQLLNRTEVDGSSISCGGDGDMEVMAAAKLEAIARAGRVRAPGLCPRDLGRAPNQQDPAPPPLAPRDAVASLVLAAVLRRVRDHDSVRAALVDTARAAAAASASAFAALRPPVDALLHERAQAMMEPWPARAGQGGNGAAACASAFGAHRHCAVIVGAEQEEAGHEEGQVLDGMSVPELELEEAPW